MYFIKQGYFEKQMRTTGTYQTLGDLSYFIPFPLPPKDPPLELTPEMMSLYGEASFALGQLNEMSRRLPSQERFIKAYVIKEALLSSAIEGIHTTLIDVFTSPLGYGKQTKETQLVLNYTQALGAALSMLRDEELPLVMRVILKAHEVLMSTSGDANQATPGCLRQQSVRVGSLIPPPAPELPSLMSALERYINEPSSLPPLIQAGLVHVGFETIHPFLDGNGRIGRLLIVLMLIDKKLLREPILYPSYYFKKYHLEYYEALDRVRTRGDYEGWVIYYLKAIRDSAIDAHLRAKNVERLTQHIKDAIHQSPVFSKIRETAFTALEHLFVQPVITVAEMGKKLGRTYNTAQNILRAFVQHGWVNETIIHKRNKVYRFKDYLFLLEKDA